MRIWIVAGLVSSVALVGGSNTFAEPLTSSNGQTQQTTQSPAPSQQSWQLRRSVFLDAMKRSRAGDKTADAVLDNMLSDFEQHPHARTPMENTDILAVVGVKKYGFERTLPLYVENVTLGWYDALRFGSESGRVEIVNNEAFFKKIFVVSGPEDMKQYLAFMTQNKEKTAALVAEALSLAEKDRNDLGYDPTWPTAYGMEPMTCALGGDCKHADAAPKDKWDDLWAQAKQRIETYYTIK